MLFDKIRPMRIVQKLIVGYVLLICIPFALFGYLFYTQLVDNVLEQYRSDQAQFAEQAYGNFETELSKIESVYPLFQNNTRLTDYLSGFFTTDWEMVYTYNREIRPTFSFMYISNPSIANIRIYKNDKDALQLEPDIVDRDVFEDERHAEAIGRLPPDQGLWTYDANEATGRMDIHYTRKLYNDSFTRELGLLRITAEGELFNTLFDTLYKEHSWKALLDAEGRPVYESAPPEFDRSRIDSLLSDGLGNRMRSFYTEDHRYLVHVIDIRRLELTMVDVSEVGPVANLRSAQGWYMMAGLVLLIVLSLVYFMVASSIALRIIRFSRHLKRVPELKLAAFPGHAGSDEIGFLISTYNAMILRMEEMGEKMHRTELLKKEAEIKMLQAQIKPHFLYNTLETMRMMAVMKNENELAEVAFTLGNLIRYSLAKAGDETTLQREIENVEDYIAIHRVRMGDRLEFSMSVEGDVASIRCPRFILQPIVENSILHGLGNVRRRGVIRLDVRELEDHVRIEVFNNGETIPPDRLAQIRDIIAGKAGSRREESGIGLVNVQERLKAFFGERSGITVTSEEGEGTVFALILEKERGG